MLYVQRMRSQSNALFSLGLYTHGNTAILHDTTLYVFFSVHENKQLTTPETKYAILQMCEVHLLSLEDMVSGHPHQIQLNLTAFVLQVPCTITLLCGVEEIRWGETSDTLRHLHMDTNHTWSYQFLLEPKAFVQLESFSPENSRHQDSHLDRYHSQSTNMLHSFFVTFFSNWLPSVVASIALIYLRVGSAAPRAACNRHTLCARDGIPA